MIIFHSTSHSNPLIHNIVLIAILNLNFISNSQSHNAPNLYNHTIDDFYKISKSPPNLLQHSLYPNTNNT